MAQSVTDDHAPAREAECARGANVVGLERLHHAGARQSHDGRRGVIAERHRGQDEVLPSRVTGDWEPAEEHAEHVDQPEREQEGRQRLPRYRDPQRDAVDHGVRAQRRDDAERDREREREPERQHAERRGDRDVLGEYLTDAQLEIMRAAEIAGDEAADPGQVLLPDRAVEAIELADRLDVLGRGILARPWRRPGRR